MESMDPWWWYFRLTMKNNPEDIVFDISPLGGNGVEGTVTGFAEVRDTSVHSVPLFWDDRVKAYISEQAIEELDDKDLSEKQAEIFNKEEEFRMKAGYKRSL